KNSGQAVILEFSKPVRSPFRQIYNIYFSSILPRIGKVVSGDPQAYRYLPESVDAFPEGEQFLEILRDSGFSECGKRTLTFGVATVYYGMKVQSSFSGTQ
ncbi:MAG TPA: class I SAM-dependent methyltransferase, partial [Prolixibacteraceae bacterium]|nr:class I SAM-dependent methyltransferase [Prolixibacteraceae bacterium]